MQRTTHPLTLALLLIAIYMFVNAHKDGANGHQAQESRGQVVVAAPIQLLLYGGDRFLAADIEAIRAATITIDNENDQNKLTYRERSHRVVAELNPCHEDNYYLGNAILSWGGLQDEGSKILAEATQCRFWDEVPPFFLGFNQYFFYHDTDSAIKNLEIAAKRSTSNAAALRKLAIMLKVEKIDDEQMALGYLREQINRTDDLNLKRMLNKRLKRLEGLIVLRKAQKQYEEMNSLPLTNPQQLITSGILKEFPEDPMRLGYDFSAGTFQLRKLHIQGLSEKQ